MQKRSIDVAKEKSLVEKQSKKADSEGKSEITILGKAHTLISKTEIRPVYLISYNYLDESATKRPRKTVIYDEEDDELPVRKPVKKAVTTSTKVNKAPSAKGNVESEDEWADEMSEASVSVASGGDDSFVVEDSEESAESSGDELFNSDSEEEVSRKKHKSAVKPPLVPSAKKAPTATKSTNKSVSNITTTPKKGNNGGRVLIPFDGSAMKTPGSVGSNPLSAFKQSNLALISPRSQSGSPFFGTPGSAAGTGSPSDAGSVHSFSGSTAAGGGGTPSTLVLPEGVVGRGSHEHNSFAFLLPENRRDGAGVKLGQAGFNPRTLQVPPKFLADQTPAMVQWWQFKAVNMDTVLFFKVGIVCYVDLCCKCIRCAVRRMPILFSTSAFVLGNGKLRC